MAVHQRLDRDTSGVVLFATDPRANENLARAFAGREVEKTYLALDGSTGGLPRRGSACRSRSRLRGPAGRVG